MTAAPVPVLFVHYGGQWIRGSERILVDHVRHLNPARFTPVIWTNCRPLVELARGHGWPAAEDPFSVLLDHGLPRFDIFNYRRLLNRACALIREHRIGLVHCNASESAQWMVPAARGGDIPIVVHLHNDATVRSRTVQLVHQATAIVGGCDAMIEPYRDEGVPSRFLRIIYNNVDTERMSSYEPVSRASLGILDDEFVFMSVGSLVQRKGMDVLVRAFARVRASAPARLVIVGSGPERLALQRLVGELGLDGVVVFLGESASAPGVVRDLSDTSVLASHWEGFPLVLLEAGFFGKPVIATNVGGVPDLIRHEETGLLVPPHDVAAVQEAMLRLLGDRELRERLGAGLAHLVHSRMLAPTNTRQLEALYDECLDAQRRKEVPGWRWYRGYSRWLRRGIASTVRRLAGGGHVAGR